MKPAANPLPFTPSCHWPSYRVPHRVAADFFGLVKMDFFMPLLFIRETSPSRKEGASESFSIIILPFGGPQRSIRSFMPFRTSL
jgi:hypothetical protein